ncbi:hypothetical protein DVH24_022200 [Malus domestica]|uniref:Uncharacterized protein n=1 Tax=Malus domestica TaxID=3750 RepID=A0A498IX93_MALDO|nr:hypothetical protein DVH24_022200 [Malus domestica]
MNGWDRSKDGKPEHTCPSPLGIAGPARAGFVDAITALIKAITSIKISRGSRECMRAFPNSLLACPSFHGGRGALPSAGGHPSDLTYLAGGGCF